MLNMSSTISDLCRNLYTTTRNLPIVVKATGAAVMSYGISNFVIPVIRDSLNFSRYADMGNSVRVASPSSSADSSLSSVMGATPILAAILTVYFVGQLIQEGFVKGDIHGYARRFDEENRRRNAQPRQGGEMGHDDVIFRDGSRTVRMGPNGIVVTES